MPAIDAAVGVSKASLKDMVTMHGFAKPSTFIYRAINTAAFDATPTKLDCRAQLHIADNEQVLLFLGNLTTQKRPDRFLQIVAKVKATYPTIQAWIVGDGTLRKTTEQLAEVLRITENVRFWGYQTNVATCVTAADILVLPSDTEGLPGVVLEAAYAHVPTVGSLVGGIQECLEDGETGFIIAKKDNIQDYVDKIEELLNNESLRQQMGTAARQKVAAQFTIERVGVEYINFFNSLLQ
jgi:glycosyltransferase involved in cell wall biosynthesis